MRKAGRSTLRSVEAKLFTAHLVTKIVRVTCDSSSAADSMQVERLQDFIRKWSKRRVSIDGPEWQGVVRPAGTKYGVPKTGMAVSESRTNLGAKLSFDGSPTDELDINIRHLRCEGAARLDSRSLVMTESSSDATTSESDRGKLNCVCEYSSPWTSAAVCWCMILTHSVNSLLPGECQHSPAMRLSTLHAMESTRP